MSATEFTHMYGPHRQLLTMVIMPIGGGALVGGANLFPEVGWVALPALTIWWGSLRVVSLRAKAISAVLFAGTSFGVTWHWVLPAFQDPASAAYGIAWIIPGALLFILASVFAASVVLTEKCSTWVPAWIGVAILISIVEAVVPTVFGLPMPPVALALLDTPMSAAAAFGGQPMLSLVTLLLATGLEAVVKRPVTAALCVSAGLHVFPEGGKGALIDQTVALVQTGRVAETGFKETGFSDHIQNLVDRAAENNPDIIILPENAVRVPILAERFDGGQVENDIPILFGAPRDTLAEHGRYTVSAFLAEGGNTRAVYDKQHLVPFFETNPLPSLIPDLSPVRVGGAQAVVAYNDKHVFLPLLCFEVLFPVNHGGAGPRPDWIALLSSDRHFRSEAGQSVLLGFARLRAVESGLPVLRASDLGVSAIIAANGTVLESVAGARPRILTGRVPVRSRISLFWKFGNLPFALFCAALLIASILFKKGISRA